MYRYDYIAVEDWDEVIMPVNHTNWNEMMIYIKNISGRYLNILEKKQTMFPQIQILQAGILRIFTSWMKC